MAIVLVEVDVSGFTSRELTSRQVTSNWRIPVVDGDVIRDRIVSSIDLPAHGAHESVLRLLDVFFVAAPS